METAAKAGGRWKTRGEEVVCAHPSRLLQCSSIRGYFRRDLTLVSLFLLLINNKVPGERCVAPLAATTATHGGCVWLLDVLYLFPAFAFDPGSLDSLDVFHLFLVRFSLIFVTFNIFLQFFNDVSFHVVLVLELGSYFLQENVKCWRY